MSENKNYEVKNKEEKNQEATLDIVLKKEFVEKFKEKAVKNLGKDIEVKGFRKGEAPENLITEKVGEMKIVEEQSQLAIFEVLPEIVINEKIEALTSPKINITKIAPGSDLEFKAVFTLIPKVELADYVSIAKSIKATENVEVTDKEISDYIDYIRKNKQDAANMQKKAAGEEVDEKSELPEFNDEFVKTLGDFKNVDDFKAQLKENMTKEKTNMENNKRRTAIIEKIITESTIDLPEVLVQEEQDRMLRQYKHDIEHMGIKFEDYLKEIKKDEEGLKKEWHADAVKRAKMNMILPKIAQKEGITADPKTLEKEVKHMMEHHKDINEQQASFYLSHILTNEAVFKFLETQK